ncbi:DUF6585 family protein [Thermogemmatispora tikiterensis]|uniref:Uncharacterized protein n=1 Tax=Thermogemmatispora tikiterensis TaxID=1825093 RepID=A0A328VLA4_9CHLR|nr:DUF6585 family protein [Thermogemmatispora tikiterensis]RAQ98496.1 hypothetical protein A4R35_23340 [Thermogemmatispora tikiterensis]
MLQSPHEQTQQPLLVPADVKQQAQRADLGLPQRHYRPSALAGFEDYLGVGKILLYMFLSYLVIKLIIDHNNILETLYECFILSLFIAGVLLILSSPFFLLALLLYRTRKSWGIYVYDRGFVYKEGRRLIAYRWDQITALWLEVKREMHIIAVSDSFVDYTEIKILYELEFQGGKKLRFNFNVVKMPEMISLLEERICSCLLPQAIAAFEAGETVRFGEVSVNRAGLSYKDSTLLWSEMLDITIDGTSLTIKKWDKKNVSWSLSRLPNIRVFLGLKDYIFQRYLGIVGLES